MGVSGVGLYSGDFALDLRSTVRAVLRLPFDPDKLVEILSATNASAANDPQGDEHAMFWLVVADQFARRGVACDRVRREALAIIDDGSDIAALKKLGMKNQDLRKRQRVLAELRARLLAVKTSRKKRSVLHEPQPLLMDVGDVLVYPTCDGENVNPYYPSKDRQVRHTKDGPGRWEQNGWGALVILDCGRAFDLLSWYRPAVLAETRAERPTPDSVRGAMLWRLGAPGTCSPSHFRRMELEKIATFPVDRIRSQAVFPRRFGTGVSAAAQDLSMANSMKSVPAGTAVPNPEGVQKWRLPTLSAIEQVLAR